jgi:hypothetical protein
MKHRNDPIKYMQNIKGTPFYDSIKKSKVKLVIIFNPQNVTRTTLMF